jgi:nicotinamidase-related amidase
MDTNSDWLPHGPLGAGCAHLCVDMQRIFDEETPWKTPWLRRVLPNIVEIASANPGRTIFTRFVPADRPGEGLGTWKQYYERWADMTLERIGRDMVDLVPELAMFAPPAAIVDKRTYSPWQEPRLHAWLRQRGKYSNHNRRRDRCLRPCDRSGRRGLRVPGNSGR